MKRLFALLLSCLLPALTVLAASEDAKEHKLTIEAKSVAGRFVGMLKPRLQAAMQAGGPVHAIEVCSVDATEIAWNLSGETSWEVKRVSLKPRNASFAQPDAWERAQLETFDALVAKGTRPQAVSEWVDGRFRVLQPQPVEGLCLACHGEKLDPAVSAALKKYYPKDKATGYQPGQVRGAISLTYKP